MTITIPSVIDVMRRTMSSIEVPMTLEKETKRMYRFMATNVGAAIQTIYIDKAAFVSTPKDITITVNVP